MRLPRILLIVVDYQSSAHTRELINSALGAAEGVELMIRVVDNASVTSTDPSAFGDFNDSGKHSLLCPGRNLGYFGAAQWALEQERNLDAIDWVIVSNPDIRFPHCRFFASLAFRHNQAVFGIVAPRIRSALTGHEENPFLHRRPSRTRMAAYRYLFASYAVLVLFQALARPLRKLMVWRQQAIPEPANIYGAHGSCVILGRAYFETGGDLRHHSFLYGEEVFLAETCRKLGLPIFFDPELELIHLGHATTGITKTPKIARWEADAALRNFRKYFSGRSKSQ